MSRGTQPFKQGDVTKAVKAVEKAGLRVGRVEIEQGKIVVIPRDSPSATAGNEWDNVR